MSTDLLYTIDIPEPAGKHVCVPELLERVRFDFDIASTSQRLTDAQLLSVINRSRDSLFKVLVEHDQTYLRASTTLTTTQDTAAVTLPERFYAAERITYTDQNGKERELPLGRHAGERMAPSSDSWEQRRPYYVLRPLELLLYPTPAAPRTLQLVYLKSWPVLILPPGEPSCWDVQPDWDEWVVADTCAILSRRSRRAEDHAMFSAARNAITLRFEAALSAEQFEGPRFARRVMFAGDCDEDG